MGSILQNESKSLRNITWLVEIHKVGVADVVRHINLASPAFTLDYEGAGNPVYENRIMSSTCSITLLVNNSTDLATINDMVNAKESDYFLTIKRSGFLFWHGIIVLDQFNIPRKNLDGVIKINLTANDRLKVLEDLDFDFGTFSLPYGRERGLVLINQILNKNASYITDLYAVGDDYILDGIAIKGSNQPNGTLFNTSYKRESFLQDFDPDDDQKKADKWINCREALENILSTFNAKILLSNGRYFIKQFEQFYTAGPSLTYFAYSKNLTALTNNIIQRGLVIIEAIRPCFKKNEVSFTYQPALRQVKANYEKLNIDFKNINTVQAIDIELINNINSGDTYKNKYCKIALRMQNIGYRQVGQHEVVNDIFVNVLFWVRGVSNKYYHLINGVLVDVGMTLPTTYYMIAQPNPDISAVNTVYDHEIELLMPNEELQSYYMKFNPLSNWYGNVTRINPNNGVKFTRYEFKFQNVTFGIAQASIQFSQNLHTNNEKSDYKIIQTTSTDIKAGNEKLTKKADLNLSYYSGNSTDINGVLGFDNSLGWLPAAFDLAPIGLAFSANLQGYTPILIANFYEKNVATIEGSILTNGSQYAHNDIFVDSFYWFFNGGIFDSREESWNGQWIKASPGTISTGNNGGWNGKIDKYFDKFDKISTNLKGLIGQSGMAPQRVITDILKDNSLNTAPLTKQKKLISLDLETNGDVKWVMSDRLEPFGISLNVSTFQVSTTGNIIITGNYFTPTTEVTISSGTINLKTVNSASQITLNITSSAAPIAVTITINGTVYTGLLNYVFVYLGTRANQYIAARGIIDVPHQNALRELELDLFIAGLLDINGNSTKLLALWLYGGTIATAAGHKWNFLNALDTNAAYRQLYYGGLTHNSNGITGNAIDGYIDTNFRHSNFPAINSVNCMVYIRNHVTNAAVRGVYGARHSSFHGTVFFPSISGQGYSSINVGTGGGTPIANTAGLWITNNNTQVTSNLFKNGTLFAASISGTPTTNQPTATLKGLCVDFNNGEFIYQFSNYNICGLGFGAGLTNAEILAYSNALNAYYTKLGINIY